MIIKALFRKNEEREEEKTTDEYTDIMNEITLGLSGDKEKDILYLMDSIRSYEDHELSKEIKDKCNQMINLYMDENLYEQNEELALKKAQEWNLDILESQSLIHKHKFDESLVIMERIIKEIDSMKEKGFYQNNNNKEYFSFEEVFESILYKRYKNHDSEIKNTNGLPFAKVYMQYGETLVYLRRLEEAKKAFKEGMKWNPVNNEIAFKYAEVCKMSDDYETFFDVTKECFKYSYTPENLAQCYRNAASYFVEKQQYQDALAALMWGLSYEDEDEAEEYGMQEFVFIQTMADEELKKPSMDDIKNVCDQYGFPFGYYEDTVTAAVVSGTEVLTNGNYPCARYFLNIAYSMTHAEKIKEMIDTLPKRECDVECVLSN